jgi:hypothetical protein
MAQQALGAGTTRKRVLFGLLDADGWTWALVKAAVWLVIIIMLLGYIPDRAYYFTVFPTIDLGLNPMQPPASYVTPINLCPAENEDLPCPVPVGAVLPWQLNPTEIDLPAPRTNGALAQIGTTLLFVGGDPTTDEVLVSTIVDGSTFDKWTAGPRLPAPRADAAVIFSGGSIYLIGGREGTTPVDTVWALTPDPETGALGDWAPVEALTLPEARAGASVVAAPDGLLLVGGDGPSGPTATVWKSSLDPNTGKLTKWVPNQPLPGPRADAGAALVGDYLWVYGGRDANGPTASVTRGLLELPEPDPEAAPGTPDPVSTIVRWDLNPEADLPAPRTNASSWTANGAIYLIGGTDGSATKGELYWATPSAEGDIPEWKSLAQSDLPEQGLQGAAALVSGSWVFLVGGETDGGVLASSVRADLAPKAPFFQLGLLGATIPALKIEGEIGQQLGYLNAAGAGTLNFAVLIVVGWGFANRDKAKGMLGRFVRRWR